MILLLIFDILWKTVLGVKSFTTMNEMLLLSFVEVIPFSEIYKVVKD